MRKILLGSLIWLIYRLWSWTWRVELHEPEELTKAVEKKSPFILAHWHGDELALIQLIKRYRIGTITSTSKDGELMDQVLKLLGAATSRGSSTRGGVGALKGMIDLFRRGRSVSFAVDGPKGPIYQVKPGVFEVSRIQQVPIYAAGVACERAIRFPRSWNQTYFPKPFARIVIFWVGPLPGLTREQDPRSPELAEHLKNQLFAAKHNAAKLFADPKGTC